MATVLITGANRGLGLEHARQALVAGDSVIACCRTPDTATELQRLAALYGAARLRLEMLDAGSGVAIDSLAARLVGVPVDLLINNAGIFGSAPWPEGASTQSLDSMDYGLWEQILRVNLLGAFHVTSVLLPNLLAGQGRKIVMMSSDMGSIGANTLGSAYAYRTSKAALNMVTRGLAVDLQGRGVTVISMAPGWVRTDLGGPKGIWSVEDSVTAQRGVIASLTAADSGKFINLKGVIVPW